MSKMNPPWSSIIANADHKALIEQAKKLRAHPALPRAAPSRRQKRNAPQPMPGNLYAGASFASTVKYPTQAGMRYARGQQAALVAQDGLTGTAGRDRLAMYQGTKPQ